MKTDNVILDKSYVFALSIVKLYKQLNDEHHNFAIGNQLLRSGTSVGANIREGVQAQSTPDFISKLSISLKEANETEYWLMLLRDSGYMQEEQAQNMLNDCKELIKILTSIIKTTKARQV